MSIQSWLNNSTRLKVLVCWLLLILGWEAAYRVIGWKPVVFPWPTAVVDSTLDMLGVETHFGEAIHPGWPLTVKPWAGTEQPHEDAAVTDAVKPGVVWRTISSPLMVSLGVSGFRLIIGFVLSIVLGMLLGLMMWRYKFVDAMLGPVFLGLQTLPSVCWVPLAIALLHITESGVLFVLIMGSFFAIAISLRDGLRMTPPIYRAAGLVFGARRWNFYRYVMLPAGLPALASSLRSGFSFAWRSLMGGELMFTALNYHGIGYELHIGREYGGIARVVAVMIIMIAIGMICDRTIFAPIERRVRIRFGLTQ